MICSLNNKQLKTEKLKLFYQNGNSFNNVYNNYSCIKLYSYVICSYKILEFRRIHETMKHFWFFVVWRFFVFVVLGFFLLNRGQGILQMSTKNYLLIK